VTERIGYIGNNYGPNRISSGSSTRVSRSKYPKSESTKLTSKIPLWTSMMPTAWPAKTVLILIYCGPDRCGRNCWRRACHRMENRYRTSPLAHSSPRREWSAEEGHSLGL